MAVAIHNVPEGLAVSGPTYATGSRRRAFLWSFPSGMSEPLGAVMTALILLPFLSPGLLGVVLAGVAGLIAFISADELVPAACSLCDDHLPIAGVLAGMMLMSVKSLATGLSGVGGEKPTDLSLEFDGSPMTTVAEQVGYCSATGHSA